MLFFPLSIVFISSYALIGGLIGSPHNPFSTRKHMNLLRHGIAGSYFENVPQVRDGILMGLGEVSSHMSSTHG